MIGLSVSFCIRDIVQGRMPLEQVEKIVAGTMCIDDKAWEELIRVYRNSYWTDNPDECERILRQLLADGKVEQPRVSYPGNHGPQLATKKGIIHWVNTEAEIHYSTL